MILFLMVAGGLLLLYFGGELLVRGAVALARRLGVSPLLIGLTVVAAGTSAPELFVSLIAALEGSPGIAVGNVVGSNIANILLVLGAAGLIYPLARKKHAVYRDGSVLVAASFIFVALCMGGTITRWAGIVMVLMLAIYLFGTYWSDRRNTAAQKEIEAEIKELSSDTEPALLSLAKIVLGIAGVIFGSDLLVDGAKSAALAAGVGETVIGITLVALGTSLPELAASVIAARHKHTDVALGNAIGSCIFNILAIMGITSIVVPIQVPPQILTFDIWVMTGVALAFVLLALRWDRLPRWVAGAMLILYLGYVALQFIGISAISTLAGTGG
jgi:cation:H+ antiporter